MNGEFYQNPTFPTNQNYGITDKFPNSDIKLSPPGNISSMNTIPMEQSYIENILRLNKGRRVNAYVSFPDSSEWQNKIFKGIIEQAGRDHLIISDPENGNWYLIRLIYLDYVEFMEPITYTYPYEKTSF